MFELIFGFAVCVAVGKLAEKNGGSAIVWGGMTFVLCLVSMLIPLPYLRMLVAGCASLVANVALNSMRK